MVTRHSEQRQSLRRRGPAANHSRKPVRRASNSLPPWQQPETALKRVYVGVTCLRIDNVLGEPQWGGLRALRQPVFVPAA